MENITKKDIFSFCKVLRSLSEAIESNPEDFQKLVETTRVKIKNDEKSDITTVHQESADISNLTFTTEKPNIDRSQVKTDFSDLYSRAKELSYEELLEVLKTLNVDELKLIIKNYNFGYSKLRSAESLSKYIAEQLKKRTTDVFLKHEK